MCIRDRVYCETCGWQPLPEDQLPLLLPDVESYEPTDDGESPLSKMTEWVSTTCPHCGGPARRETLRAFTAWAAGVDRGGAGGLAAFLRVVDSAVESGAVQSGGTPVLLGERLLEILSAVRRHFAVQPESEITLEANPAAMTFAQLQALREGGFNRISMGVQSASDRELQTLGRRHSFVQAQESVRMAQAAGFRNVSVDLMLGTPGQTAQAIDRFVETFDALGVRHISGYLLKIEPGTPFARQHVERDCPDEERSAELYLHTVEQMARHGFLQYEVSNFARPGFESRHNLKSVSYTHLTLPTSDLV